MSITRVLGPWSAPFDSADKATVCGRFFVRWAGNGKGKRPAAIADAAVSKVASMRGIETHLRRCV